MRLEISTYLWNHDHNLSLKYIHHSKSFLLPSSLIIIVIAIIILKEFQ